VKTTEMVEKGRRNTTTKGQPGYLPVMRYGISEREGEQQTEMREVQNQGKGLCKGILPLVRCKLFDEIVEDKRNCC